MSRDAVGFCSVSQTISRDAVGFCSRPLRDRDIKPVLQVVGGWVGGRVGGWVGGGGGRSLLSCHGQQIAVLGMLGS